MENTGWISQLIGLAVVIIGSWFARKITTPTAQQRAQHLAQIAADAAALVVSLYPSASWSTLLENTVQALISAAGLGITNRQALERAAAGALARLGKVPGA